MKENAQKVCRIFDNLVLDAYGPIGFRHLVIFKKQWHSNTVVKKF